MKVEAVGPASGLACAAERPIDFVRAPRRGGRDGEGLVPRATAEDLCSMRRSASSVSCRAVSASNAAPIRQRSTAVSSCTRSSSSAAAAAGYPLRPKRNARGTRRRAVGRLEGLRRRATGHTSERTSNVASALDGMRGQSAGRAGVRRRSLRAARPGGPPARRAAQRPFTLMKTREHGAAQLPPHESTRRSSRSSCDNEDEPSRRRGFQARRGLSGRARRRTRYRSIRAKVLAAARRSLSAAVA